MIISFILVTLLFDPGGYCKEKLDASHSQGLKEGGGVSPTSWTSNSLVQPDKKFFLIIIWGKAGSCLKTLRLKMSCFYFVVQLS